MDVGTRMNPFLRYAMQHAFQNANGWDQSLRFRLLRHEIGIVQLEGLTLDSVSQRVDQKEEHVHEKKVILHPLDNGEQHVVGTTSFSLQTPWWMSASHIGSLWMIQTIDSYEWIRAYSAPAFAMEAVLFLFFSIRYPSMNAISTECATSSVSAIQRCATSYNEKRSFSSIFIASVVRSSAAYFSVPVFCFKVAIGFSRLWWSSICVLEIRL